jgi:hypothetical protein
MFDAPRDSPSGAKHPTSHTIAATQQRTGML